MSSRTSKKQNDGTTKMDTKASSHQILFIEKIKKFLSQNSLDKTTIFRASSHTFDGTSEPVVEKFYLKEVVVVGGPDTPVFFRNH